MTTTLMMMTTNVITSQLAATSPLTEVPLLGGVVKAADGLLRDLSVPLWLAETIELVGLVLLFYALLALLLRKGLPWLAPVLDEALAWVFDRVAMLLLVPELVATRIRTRMGKRPFTVAYAYGDGVISLARAAKSVTHVVFDVLPRMRTTSRAVPAVLVLLFALVWNNETCTGAPDSSPCVSPATQWITVAGEWFDTLGKK